MGGGAETSGENMVGEALTLPLSKWHSWGPSQVPVHECRQPETHNGSSGWIQAFGKNWQGKQKWEYGAVCKGAAQMHRTLLLNAISIG